MVYMCSNMTERSCVQFWRTKASHRDVDALTGHAGESPQKIGRTSRGEHDFVQAACNVYIYEIRI